MVTPILDKATVLWLCNLQLVITAFFLLPYDLRWEQKCVIWHTDLTRKNCSQYSDLLKGGIIYHQFTHSHMLNSLLLVMVWLLFAYNIIESSVYVGACARSDWDLKDLEKQNQPDMRMFEVNKQKLRNFYDFVQGDVIYCFIDHLFQLGR